MAEKCWYSVPEPGEDSVRKLPRLAPVVYGVGSLAGVGMAILFLIQASRGEIFSIGAPVLGELSIFDLTLRFLALGFVQKGAPERPSFTVVVRPLALTAV